MQRRPSSLDDPLAVASGHGQFVGSGSHSDDPGLPPPARGPPQGLELERMLTLPEVSDLTGLSPDTLKRRYAHLIRRMSPRRIAMKLRDALSIGATI
jgi:hypothetical protein